MEAQTIAPERPKPRKRKAEKLTAPKVESKTKLGLCLTPESAKRLGVYATMEGLDRSEVVEDLIRQHLRKYVVQTRDRTGGESSPGPATVEGSAGVAA